MGAIEDVRNLLQDIVAPDIKAIKVDIGGLKDRVSSIETRLTAMEGKLDKNHAEQMAAIGQLANYLSLADRVTKIETKIQ